MDKLENIQSYIDFVKTNLEPLAQQLKVGVDFLWNILVKQAQVEAIVYLIIAISFFITTAILFKIFFYNFKKAEFGDGIGKKVLYKHKNTGLEIKRITQDWDNRNEYLEVDYTQVTNKNGYISIISGILAVLMLITSIASASTSVPIIVTGLINPEYRAIEKIVEFAKPNVDKVKQEVIKESK